MRSAPSLGSRWVLRQATVRLTSGKLCFYQPAVIASTGGHTNT